MTRAGTTFLSISIIANDKRLEAGQQRQAIRPFEAPPSVRPGLRMAPTDNDDLCSADQLLASSGFKDEA